MVNRLKPILMKIIPPEQHGFTSGREIMDSIIMVAKTIHSMHTSKFKGMIIKLDVTKAYDRVTWSFLIEVLRKFGFDKRWLKCIEHCISSVNFSIIVNGSVSSFFQATNGLRQGDPLLPFLFVLMAEVLCRHIMGEAIGKAGQIQMIKSVLSVVPVYYMSCYRLSCKASSALDEMLKNFIWEGSKEEKKILLINWDTAYMLKEEGGAGLRKMNLQNLALGAKLAWKMYNLPHKGWCKLMATKYLDSNEPERIFTVANTVGGSKIWKFIWESRKILTYHLTWRIGNGLKEKFWRDSWNGEEALADVIEDEEWINQIEAVMGVYVADYVDMNCSPNSPISWKRVGDWHSHNSLKLAEILKSRKTYILNENDSLVWNATKLGKYKSSSHYQGAKSVERKKVKWTPPPPRWKKLNFDGASRGNHRLSGFGAVVRDEKGSLVGAICGLVRIATNNVAEITGLEEDCLLQKLTDYHFHHILREGNHVADFLTNQGIAETLPTVMSMADAGNRDFQNILNDDRAHISRTGIGKDQIGLSKHFSEAKMVYHFDLSCLCHEETLEDRCERLFDIDTEGQIAIQGLLEDAFSEDRHWCDGYIYEIILCLMVDVLPSKEACV
ncbi:uncharacterized protein LOC131067114 [Cryptomeria japonica]|uniref:uncharacterized protein LOC131067114 n=1 Tax=Cryptomeria japonica TaxID=3369 RepID=UPI0027DA3980|nr:uncharacterized protein LOC131067114 [Cryptomeria japonica]